MTPFMKRLLYYKANSSKFLGKISKSVQDEINATSGKPDATISSNHVVVKLNKIEEAKTSLYGKLLFLCTAARQE